jgi:hypothetical protein
VAPAGVIIHNAEFAKWAASEKGDAAVLDGAKALAQTALDLMRDVALRERVKADFDSTREISERAIEKLHEHSPAAQADAHSHAHAGCGCA